MYIFLHVHHQFHKVLDKCLVLSIKCLVPVCQVLNTCLVISLCKPLPSKQFPPLASVKHSSTAKNTFACQMLSTAWQVIEKHLSSKYQIHVKQVTSTWNWKAAPNTWWNDDQGTRNIFYGQGVLRHAEIGPDKRKKFFVLFCFVFFPSTLKDETMIFYPIGSISVMKYFKCLPTRKK